MKFSAAGVNSMAIWPVSFIYTAAANRGTSGLMMQVFGIGQNAADAFGALRRVDEEGKVLLEDCIIGTFVLTRRASRTV
jgi:hypothetical protein